MKANPNEIRWFPALCLFLVLALISGCQTARDLNRAPLITGIRVKQGSIELDELISGSTVELEVAYTDEDYDPLQSSTYQFEPVYAWSAKLWSSGEECTESFVDVHTNPAIFKVPDKKGDALMISAEIVDRYGGKGKTSIKIKIEDNEAPKISGFNLNGKPIMGELSTVEPAEIVEIEVDYIDDSYDPKSVGCDPDMEPTFSWSWKMIDGVPVSDGRFLDNLKNPCFFLTPSEKGYIEIIAKITDREGLSTDGTLVLDSQ